MRDKPHDPSDETPVSDVETQAGLSRRDFLRLNLALLALAGTPACTGPDRRPDTRRALRLLRADDLLSLHVELENLEIVDRSYRPALLRRSVPGRDAFLVVRFAGQHIAEEAFRAPPDSSVTLPAQARMARPSQLRFRLPRDIDAIELTLEALLDWQHLELQTSPIEKGADHPGSNGATRIELPTGLVLTPDGPVSWRHPVRPVNYNGRVELWQTRMLASTPGSPPLVRIQSPGYEHEDRFVTSLQREDREALQGRQAEAHTLILSPMGGWLDVRGRWEPDAARDVARWEHRVAAGQDQKVVLEYNDGFLYPFGHRATVLRVTERRIDETHRGDATAPRYTAVLRKRDFVVVKTPTVRYRHGDMAFETITIETTVTPALKIPSKSAGSYAPADEFWIETAPGRPFLFQATADDWDQGRVTFEAAAVFVPADPDLTAADDLYLDPDYDRYRQIALQGQAAVVARFEPAERSRRKEKTDADKPVRTPGDTTLHLLSLELSAKARDSEGDSAPFRCETAAMLARLPALEPYLDDDRNRGWFRLRDPEANQGEVFAKALTEPPERSRRIPMYFDEQADLSGGLAAPSFDVDGLSRVFGAVGQAERVASGAGLSASEYFAEGKANLLGGFPLEELLNLGGSNGAPALPRIELILGRKQPDEAAATEPDPKPDKDEEPAYWEAGIGLRWEIPLHPPETDSRPLVGFEVVRDDDGRSESALKIAVEATRRLGGQPKAGRDGANADEPGRPTPANGSDKSGVNLTASGTISHFALALYPNPEKPDSLRLVFDHIEVKLGPPKPAKDRHQGPTQTDERPNEGGKGSERSFQPEIELKLARIDATGALRFIEAVIAAAANMPLPPRRRESEDAGTYPAKLPDNDDADLGVTLGPFEAPKFRLLQFEVSNVSASFGIGLNFLPRPVPGDEKPRVPDHAFSLRVASPKAPLTLLSLPWGGIAHLGLNFTTKRLTGFQYSMGVVYRAKFDLMATEATCEGSLAAMFTYSVKGDPKYQLDLIVKLSGQARLWFIDLHLLLVVIGSWADEVWSFDASLVVRVHVGFFTVESSFGFHYTIADQRKSDDRVADHHGPDGAAGRPELPQAPRLEMTEDDWLAYRHAFAGTGRA